MGKNELESELIYIHCNNCDSQNSGFLIYAWNTLGGGVGGEIFTIVMAAKITVHVSFKLTRGTRAICTPTFQLMTTIVT